MLKGGFLIIFIQCMDAFSTLASSLKAPSISEQHLRTPLASLII